MTTIMPNPRDHSLATRASLLHRLKDCDDQSSWQEFYDAYCDLIYRFALKAALTETEAQDVERQLRGASMRMRCPPTENEIDSPAQADVVSTISAARLQSRFIGASHLRDKN